MELPVSSGHNASCETEIYATFRSHQYTRLGPDGTTVLGTVIFGTGNPRQAVINRLTAQLAAKASAAPPTITGDEQELLDNLRAGTLDGYGIRIERHEEPFGISLT